MPTNTPFTSFRYYDDDEWRDWARSVSKKLDNITNLLTKQGEDIMATLDDLVTEVSDETTVVGSVAVLMDGLTASVNELKAQLAAAGMDTAKVDALLVSLQANKVALQDAVTRNTPAEG